MPRWKQNTRKLRELILFIAEESADDEVGDIYLNKVLFFSDALAVQRLGKPITGARYQRLPMGPAARALLPIREQMVKDGDVKVVMVGKQRVTIPERKADRDAFSADEIQLVLEVMAMFRGDWALTISDRSHYESPGWNLVGEREDIPLESQMISMDPISARAKQRGHELATRFGW